MPWHDEITLKLPSPHGDEPQNLRQDILDELEDHLECAMQRELRDVENERIARQRVLSRFGNPAKVARRLWLDAMKGTLMNQRIMLATNVFVAAVVVIVGVTVVISLRSTLAFQERLLERVEAIGVADRASGNVPASRAVSTPPAPENPDWPIMTLEFVGPDGQSPIAPVDLQLTRAAEHEAGPGRAIYRGTLGEPGRVTVGRVQPGEYRLTASHGNITLQRTLIAESRTDRVHTIRWIETPRRFPVALSLDVDRIEALPPLITYMRFSVELDPEDARNTWSSPDLHLLIADDGRALMFNPDNLTDSQKIAMTLTSRIRGSQREFFFENLRADDLEWSQRIELPSSVRHTAEQIQFLRLDTSADFNSMYINAGGFVHNGARDIRMELSADDRSYTIPLLQMPLREQWLRQLPNPLRD